MNFAVKWKLSTNWLSVVVCYEYVSAAQKKIGRRNSMQKNAFILFIFDCR